MPQGISGASIRGFEEVISNFNKEVMQITNGARGGLIRAAKFIQRDMETVPPLTPVDLGNLRSSFEVRSINQGSGESKQYGIEFGFYADYALWVHEMLGAVNWTRPGSGPKFLESSINRNHDTILQIIADGIKDKK